MNSAPSKSRPLIPLLLVVGLFIIYNLNARFIAGSDVYSTRYMPMNLVINHSYYLPEPSTLEPNKNWNLGTRVNDGPRPDPKNPGKMLPGSPSHGKIISVYPTWTPTVLAPVYWLFFSKTSALWGMHLDPNHFLVWYLDKWFASLMVALSCAMVFSLIRRLHGGKQAVALLITAGMGLGTSLWAIASQGSWAMGPSAFYMTTAVWCMERAVRYGMCRKSLIYGWLSGFAIASAFATRQTDIFFVFPFFIFGMRELWPCRARCAAFFAGVVPVAAWFCIHNYLYFGNPLTTGYKYNMAQQLIPELLSIKNFFSGFFGLLFSPCLGMFTTGPVTLFAVPGAITILLPRRRVIEKRSDGTVIERREAPCFILRVMKIAVPFSIIHILFYSCYLEWWAGWSYCYRYLIDIQPFVAICAAWFLRPGSWGVRYRIPFYMPALAISLVFQAYGAFFWFGRFFDPLPQNNPTYQRLYLNLDPKKGHPGVFTHESFLWSLKRENHIIFKEQFPNPQSMKNAVASWDKIKKDLFKTKLLKGHPNIILYQGQ